MHDLAAPWELSRGRFVDTIKSMNQTQLTWKLHPQSLSCGQAGIHVAGVELFFLSQLMGRTFEGHERTVAASTQGVVDDADFPIADAELTPEFVLAELDFARAQVEPVIQTPSQELLAKEIKSALGPMISGYGALTRFAFHPAYHQGQAYLFATHPDFPK